jgi:hypothetical protein
MMYSTANKLQILQDIQHGYSQWTGVILASIFSAVRLMGRSRSGLSIRGIASLLTVRRTRHYGV